MLSHADCWHALLVNPGMERSACVGLKLRRVEPYWPRYQVTLRRRRRTQVHWRSVMPGYLFVRPPLNYQEIQDAPAVRNFLRTGDGDVAGIRTDDVEKIRSIEMALNDDQVAAASAVPYKKGQEVLVRSLHIRGKVTKILKGRKVAVAVYMFGTVVPMTLSVDQIDSV